MRTILAVTVLLATLSLAPLAEADRCTAAIPTTYSRVTPQDVTPDAAFDLTMSFEFDNGYLACAWTAWAQVDGEGPITGSITPTSTGFDIDVSMPALTAGTHTLVVTVRWDLHNYNYQPTAYSAPVRAHPMCVPTLSHASPTSHVGPTGTLRALVDQADPTDSCTVAITSIALNGDTRPAAINSANDASYAEAPMGFVPPGSHTATVTARTKRTFDNASEDYSFSWTFNVAAATLNDRSRPTSGFTLEDHGIAPITVQRFCVNPLFCTDPATISSPINYELTTTVGELELYHGASAEERTYGPYRFEPAPFTACPSACLLLTPILDVGWSDVGVSTQGTVAGQPVEREVNIPGQRIRHDAYPIPLP